jgi:hypothetical protein
MKKTQYEDFYFLGKKADMIERKLGSQKLEESGTNSREILHVSVSVWRLPLTSF